MAHVLIVDDEMNKREAYKAYLEILGHTYEVSETADEALQLLAQDTDHRFDLIVTDFDTRSIKNGGDIASQYASRYRVVVLSSYDWADQDFEQRIRATGALLHNKLHKPDEGVPEGERTAEPLTMKDHLKIFQDALSHEVKGAEMVAGASASNPVPMP